MWLAGAFTSKVERQSHLKYQDSNNSPIHPSLNAKSSHATNYAKILNRFVFESLDSTFPVKSSKMRDSQTSKCRPYNFKTWVSMGVFAA